MKQDTDEIEEHLEDHLLFLQRSADSYDQGLVNECKRMAVSLRVLLHDTKASTSILSHLHRKDQLFLDTSDDLHPDNCMTFSGLVMISATNNGAEYVAPLDAVLGKWLPFDEWWNKIVFVDENNCSFTRADIVLKLANKDGGAHVDERLSEPYANLSRRNSLGHVRNDGRMHEPIEQGPEKPCVRQITHEVLRTLVPDYSKPAPTSPQNGILFRMSSWGDGKSKEKNESVNIYASPGTINLGRNKPCHCGSGKKHKRCCGKS